MINNDENSVTLNNKNFIAQRSGLVTWVAQQILPGPARPWLAFG